jgi:arylsulfatase
LDATLESSHEESVVDRLKQGVKDFVKKMPFSNELRVLRDRLRGRGTPYMEGEEVVERAEELLEEDDPEENSFYWFHFMDTHSPFVPPEETRGTWSDFGSRREVWKNLEKEEPEQLLELYDECMLYLDRNLEKLVNILEEKFEGDEFEILITSDHGELFYDDEWGAHGHPNMLKEELFEVPLFTTFEPGRGFSTHVDIVPTILDFFDVKVPEGVRGLSLLSEDSKEFDFVETDSNGNEWLEQKWRDKRAAKISKNGIVEIFDITRDEEPEDEDLKDHLERIGEKEGSSEDESDLSEEEEEKVKENLRQLGYDEKVK